MASQIQALKLEVRGLKARAVGKSANLASPQIFVMGGYDDTALVTAAEVYSFKSSQFTPSCSMLFPRSSAASSVLDDRIYVFGGGDGKNWFDTTERYDSISNSWSKCSSMKYKRGNLAGATVGGKVYALGGGNGKAQFSQVECYDAHLGAWTSSPSMLEKRYMVAAAEIGGALYALGGFDVFSKLLVAKDGALIRTMERFDPRESVWTKMPSMTSKRGSLSAAVLNGRLYALGGFDGSVFLSTVEAFDPRADRWETVSH
ncbi:hypothetical protein SELMODRAFT_99520 [Selaginella moellendorffii]|uniref:Uncharacterized protein n=1 Tax=Selaginella moellendorffii TaxID=88036 RepID=D8RRC8_SELML|nr:hypothetical protein SELMODRAFT_99520 [Selaginella moellendorffii]